MRTRAAVLRQMGLPAPYAQSQPLRIEELELLPPGRNQLLVKVLAAGLCHSDLSVIDGARPRVMPMVLGHEASGEIVEVGPDTTGYAAGERVVFSFVPGCGDCASCAGGRPALCEPGAQANTAGSLLEGTRQWRDAEALLHHHLGVSAFAEHTVVSIHSVVKIDGGLDPAIAALFGCAVLTGVGAVINTARATPGESIAVVGLGGIGQAAVLGALLSGAWPIVAVDTRDDKIEAALALGASHGVNAGDPGAAERIRALTAGGAHIAVECVGSARALGLAYAATRRGGCTVTTGLPDPNQQFAVPAVSLVAEERTIKGSYMGSSVPARDIPRYIALHRAGRLAVDRLLTHRLALDDINSGFDRLARGEAVRQVVLFDAAGAR
jgi:Zn-dependent alcohol dehydrogenase